MDSSEDHHSDRIRKHIERQEQKKKESTYVEALISTLVAQGTLQSTAFFSIDFVPLCEHADVNGETVVIPLEVALSKFTLEKGEIAHLQRLINPGELSAEENNLALVSYRHHGIGRDDVAKAKNWSAVWADIKDFICSGAQGSRAKRPILLTAPFEKSVQLQCLTWLARRARESAQSYQLCDADDFHRIMSVECNLVKSAKFENYWKEAAETTTLCEGQGPGFEVSREKERSRYSKCAMHFKKEPTYRCALSHARAVCSAFLLVSLNATFIDKKTHSSLLFRVEQVQSPPSSPLQPQPRGSPAPSQFGPNSNPSSPLQHQRSSEKGLSDNERELANMEKWDIDYAADPWHEMNNNAKRNGLKPLYENYYY